MLRSIAFVGAGVTLLALSARVQVPMVPVPMTLQSYVVLVLGALAGPRIGVGAVALYLTTALVGLPVLAGGASGVDALTGKTAGYLLGFVPAVLLCALGARTRPRWAVLFAVMLSAHAIILATGCLWLARSVGPEAALAGGVVRFLPGAFVKSALAAATALAVRRMRAERA